MQRMFEIFSFGDLSPAELSFVISFCAVIIVATGYISDAIIQHHGYGPGGNGLILVFGAALGISAFTVYLQFFDTTFAFRFYRAHMFDESWRKTIFAAAIGSLSFFLLLIRIKRNVG